MAPTLGYWAISGLAHQIRLLLNYKEAEYDEKLYQATEEGAAEWSKKDKLEMGLDLPNLPYYVDGDLKLTETLAIMYYLARKYDLCGSTDEEKYRNDMAYSYQSDARSALVRCFYNPDFENLKATLIESIPARLARLEDFLAGRNFMTGANVAMCDFSVYDCLDIHRNFLNGCLEKFPKLTAYMKRFEDLPTVKSYIGSKKYVRKPFNGPMAKWGNTK